MTILATVIVLGVLIFVHELGHFAAAKATGVDVERFSIGLGPRVVGFKHGGTDYVLSAIPLGGYVKMGGMEDEILEAIEGGGSDEPRVPGPGDLDAKPIWARALVFSGGVVMNFLFAWVAYAVAFGFWGFQGAATTRVGVVRDDLLTPGAQALTEIEPGQRIVEIGDEPIEQWVDVRRLLAERSAGPVTLTLAEPEGEITVELPADIEERRFVVGSIDHWIDAEIGMVVPGSPAADGGLEVGDAITAIDGEPVVNWHDVMRLVRPRAGEQIEITLDRNGAELIRSVTPEAGRVTDPLTGAERTVGQLGVRPPIFETAFTKASLSEAVVEGFNQTVFMTGMILGFLRDLFTGSVSPREMGSIVTIGQASGQAASLGVAYFLQFMALFSINLAVLNLLPIPILDGGHLLFLAIEAVRGKALSVEQRLRWSNVGFLIVMGIMIWALSNDMLKLFGL